MESVYMNARLLTEELMQVFNKADDHDNRGACQPDEEEIGQQVHDEIDELAHISILPRSHMMSIRFRQRPGTASFTWSQW